jgi:hypothetical protein
MLRTLGVLLVLLAAAAAAGAGEPAELAKLEALAKAAPPCDPARAHCIGLALHVAAGADGPVAPADWVARQLAEANRHFAPIGVGFQIAAVAALPAAAARIEDARDPITASTPRPSTSFGSIRLPKPSSMNRAVPAPTLCGSTVMNTEPGASALFTRNAEPSWLAASRPPSTRTT